MARVSGQGLRGLPLQWGAYGEIWRGSHYGVGLKDEVLGASPCAEGLTRGFERAPAVLKGQGVVLGLPTVMWGPRRNLWGLPTRARGSQGDFGGPPSQCGIHRKVLGGPLRGGWGLPPWRGAHREGLGVPCAGVGPVGGGVLGAPSLPGGLFFGVTAGRRPFPLQIAAKIGGDAATTVNNNTPDFGFGGQKRQLEDGGKGGGHGTPSNQGGMTPPKSGSPVSGGSRGPPNGAFHLPRPAREQEAGGTGGL